MDRASGTEIFSLNGLKDIWKGAIAVKFVLHGVDVALSVSITCVSVRVVQ